MDRGGHLDQGAPGRAPGTASTPPQQRPPQCHAGGGAGTLNAPPPPPKPCSVGFKPLFSGLGTVEEKVNPKWACFNALSLGYWVRAGGEGEAVLDATAPPVALWGRVGLTEKVGFEPTEPSFDFVSAPPPRPQQVPQLTCKSVHSAHCGTGAAQGPCDGLHTCPQICAKTTFSTTAPTCLDPQVCRRRICRTPQPEGGAAPPRKGPGSPPGPRREGRRGSPGPCWRRGCA